MEKEKKDYKIKREKIPKLEDALLTDNSGFYYMQEFTESILSVNISNFNYTIFNKDIDTMTKQEFKEYYTEHGVDVIKHIAKYIYIPNLEEITYIDTSLFTNKDAYFGGLLNFFKKIVRFFMDTLPYNYLRYISDKMEEELSGEYNIYSLLDSLDDNDNTISMFIDALDKNNVNMDNFQNTMADIEQGITSSKKKQLFETMVDLLDDNIDIKRKEQEYFRDSIKFASEEFSELIKIYLEKDSSNIAGLW